MLESLPCFRCGSGEPVLDGLCHNCVQESRLAATVPGPIPVSICSRCLRWQKGGQWLRAVDEQDLAEQVIGTRTTWENEIRPSGISLDLQIRDKHTWQVEWVARGKLGDIDLTNAGATLVHFKMTCCTDCSRKAGGYFEATLQLRGHQKLAGDIEEEATELLMAEIVELEARDPLSYLLRSARVPGGLDFVFGTKTAARQMCRLLRSRFGGRTKESPALVGRKDGRDVYRLTILLRLPDFLAGDLIRFERQLHRVIKIGSRSAVLQRCHDFQTVNRNLDDTLLRAPRIAGPEEFVGALVVERSPERVAVMHPQNYRVTDITIPEGMTARLGDEVQVAMVEGDLIVIGN